MTLTCYLLPPSPNNVKVQLALAYKGIAYDTVLVNPSDRAAVIEATGQPLTPAIVHDGTKLFDSSAIMRYIDVNFPGPRLFSEDYQAMKEIEGWERYMRLELGPFVGRTFTQLFAETKDAAETDAINAGMNAVTAKLEEHLDGREWLV
ncbi:MAG: glutathione S-transferase family protein, partial [Planctomycetota bacterium]|nr:glutathione S-transferase family protein [Planctomycetota bacterium]